MWWYSMGLTISRDLRKQSVEHSVLCLCSLEKRCLEDDCLVYGDRKGPSFCDAGRTFVLRMQENCPSYWLQKWYVIGHELPENVSFVNCEYWLENIKIFFWFISLETFRSLLAFQNMYMFLFSFSCFWQQIMF